MEFIKLLIPLKGSFENQEEWLLKEVNHRITE